MEPVRIAQATLAGAGPSQDRILSTAQAVVLLDGATALVPTAVPPTVYVDTLGSALVCGLSTNTNTDLRKVLADAIARTATLLRLLPGQSPSSTVAMVRVVDHDADVLVLGDSQIVTPGETYRDDRLSHVAAAQRTAYRSRLAHGAGYDDTHRTMIRALQAEEARWRNRPGGYWIAEADPTAARHAIVAHLPAVPWLVLSTDGAYRPMRHLGRDDWEGIAKTDAVGLAAILDGVHRWETDDDPDGCALPRAKRHDDKSLIAVTPDGHDEWPRENFPY